MSVYVVEIQLSCIIRKADIVEGYWEGTVSTQSN